MKGGCGEWRESGGREGRGKAMGRLVDDREEKREREEVDEGNKERERTKRI